MSSLHKRLVHRSTDGCCICRAKSSSSRFTASTKYEEFFTRCFQLSQPRGGDICNACVLLVKRFKKLPLNTSQHWGHVVDARYHEKVQLDIMIDSTSSLSPYFSIKLHDVIKAIYFRAGPGVKNFVRERRRESCRERSLAYKRKYSQADDEENPDEPRVSDFIDLRIWKKKKVCCGTIFVNCYGEAMIDPRFLNSSHKKNNIQENLISSFENIVNNELNAVQNANSNVTERKQRKDSEFSSDQDEGFFDRFSTSPSLLEESQIQQSSPSSSSSSLVSSTENVNQN